MARHATENWSFFCFLLPLFAPKYLTSTCLFILSLRLKVVYNSLLYSRIPFVTVRGSASATHGLIYHQIISQSEALLISFSRNVNGTFLLNVAVTNIGIKFSH